MDFQCIQFKMAVKDVQLYKGGYESRFGGRLSSVTEITGKDETKIILILVAALVY